MDAGMALRAERDQVFFGIVTRVATELSVPRGFKNCSTSYESNTSLLASQKNWRFS
jgi:hypothetical protein